MRVGGRLTILVLLVLGALAGQVALGDEPVAAGAADAGAAADASAEPGEAGEGEAGPVVAAPAVATGAVVRGTAVQVTPTLPPPPATPPATTPANADRNVVRIDWPEIPPDSGAGRRIVYSKSLQRVWMIEEDGTLFHTHRVSGRMDQPNPGTYSVWSRSTATCSNANPTICMRWMVRFAKARSGDNIGFHEIPRRHGVPLQTPELLGAPLSGGCVRQDTADAMLVWDWAQLGTVVVVLP